MKKVLKILPLGLLGAVVGYALGKFLPDYFDAGNVLIPSWYMVILFMIISFFLVIAIHEFGHAFAGFLKGFTFRFITFGPIKIEKTDRIRIHFNNNINAFGGLTLMFPQRSFSQRDMIIYYLMGPFFSIISTIGGVLLLSFGDFTGSYLQFPLMLFTLMSFAIALVTIIPLPMVDGFSNDMSQVLDLKKGGNKGTRKLFLLRLISQSINGVRPSEWDEEAFQEFIEINKDETDMFASMAKIYGFYRYMDIGKKEEAVELLDEAWELVKDAPDVLRMGIQLEYAYKAVYKEDDLELARSYQKDLKKGFVDEASLLRLEAACLMAEEKWKEAEATVADSLSYLGKSMDKGIAKLEEDWLHIMFDEIHKRIRQQTVFESES